MAEDYNTTNNNHVHELRKDVHEAHSDSKVAKLLATLALIASIVALILSIYALNEAGDAQGTANRASDAVERMQ